MSPAAPTTFAGLLGQILRGEPGRPLVTFYDDATGERVELSGTTYANWVAKTSSLLVEELDIERGSRVLVDLPTHWLVPVVMGAVWNVGAEVTGDASDADLVVCGPLRSRLEAYADGPAPVLASALLPLGVRFREPLPAGVHDFGVEVWSQPDAFVPWDPADGTEGLWHGATWSELPLDGPWAGERLLTTANPLAEPAVLLQPLVHGGSVVLWRNPDPRRHEVLRTQERVTAEHLVTVEQ
ncbi:TIGR03089 family protein [Nocardioides jiangxiensis]|uniref:TIGR03089 family protein n=1 Tax=Nocardioides jiangxiensis TaxID=3064524 RepID=A0ABT9AY38_9ACTN|nr:TIGR03089 family protein [Nocardioides sp. WY-20]MDO7867486.1 TIGR03089 family protein [Nocardioides sp. WY-20]